MTWHGSSSLDAVSIVRLAPHRNGYFYFARSGHFYFAVEGNGNRLDFWVRGYKIARIDACYRSAFP
jgi:hypothetical protein